VSGYFFFIISGAMQIHVDILHNFFFVITNSLITHSFCTFFLIKKYQKIKKEMIYSTFLSYQQHQWLCCRRCNIVCAGKEVMEEFL
jgi:hypothetical protein